MRLSVNGCFIAGCPYGRNRSIGGMNPYSIAAARNEAARRAYHPPFWVMSMLPPPFWVISVGWLPLGRLLPTWTQTSRLPSLFWVACISLRSPICFNRAWLSDPFWASDISLFDRSEEHTSELQSLMRI